MEIIRIKVASMNKRQFIISIFLGALLVILAGFTAVFANSNQNLYLKPKLTQFYRKGFYIGAILGAYGHELPEGAALTDVIFEPVVPFFPGALAGYQFNKYFAIQGEFLVFDHSSSDGYTLNGKYLHAPDHHYLYSGNLLLKGMLPLGKYFSLNGYAGAAVVHEDTFNIIYPGEPPAVNKQVTTLSPDIGVGVEFYFPKYVSIGVSYMYIPAGHGIHSIRYIPLNISFRF